MGSITESQTPTGDDDMVIHARKQLRLSKAQQRLVLVLMAKDLADALIAVQDLVGAPLDLEDPVCRYLVRYRYLGAQLTPSQKPCFASVHCT